VDCSDHEVNIKIMLDLSWPRARHREAAQQALAVKTEEVGKLVLADNYYQTQSLSVPACAAEKLLDAQAALIPRAGEGRAS
jgi:glutamate dehydrogenase